MVRTDELEYELPSELIATRPAEPRDSARMLVVSRRDERLLEHRTVRDLPDYLRASDAAVFNRSRVVRARFFGRRAGSGGRVEGLFLEAVDGRRWRVLLKSNGRLREGVSIELFNSAGSPAGVTLTIDHREGERWIVAADQDVEDVETLLETIGATPLPPYILNARKEAGVRIDDEEDRRRYQTVYAEARAAGAGSVAAPTAGLHFTPELLKRLDDGGVRRLGVELQVGWGTFRPVQSDRLEDHPMHAERFAVPAGVVGAVRNRADGRVFAIGTTTARALESLPEDLDAAERQGWRGETELLIAPGYRWRFVDGMLTNFHLPRSTLLAMVAALFDGGMDRLLEIYDAAVREEYRFYSYGDAMLILP